MNPAYQLMIGAWIVVAGWVVLVIYTNRKVHPKALFALFMTELWERFSYYGMRAFLVLYLTSQMVNGGFGMLKKDSNAIYAAYGSLVYLTPLLGGFLADKFLGFRRSIIWGAILMAMGQFILASSQEEKSKLLLFAGLGLLTIGNGFFKPNISSLVGKFYGPGDPRRDGAFTIFYMGINLGAFLAPLTCAAVGEIEGWRYGFLLAGAGMLIGLGVFLWTIASGLLEDKAEPPAAGNRRVGPFRVDVLIYAGTFLLLPIAGLLIHHNEAMDVLLSVVGLAMIGFMLFLSSTYGKIERERIWVIVILLLFTTVFWTFFELAGSALNLFTERNVDKTLFGMKTTTTFYQAVNPGFIMIFAPLFAMLWLWLGKRRIDPPAPYKFALGLALLGVGFLVLNAGRPFVTNGMMPAIFLILLYLFHTLGELVLSPVGLSLVTKLAPARIVGLMFGFWFLSSAIAHQAGKWIANESVDDNTEATAEQTLDLALGVFNNVGLFSLGAAALLLCLSPLITKWMHGVDKPVEPAPPQEPMD